MNHPTLVLGIALVACTSSTPPPSSASSKQESVLPFCESPTPTACPRSTCGANSPIINTFPINGLRADGECNREGVQLLPGSMTGGVDNACEGATLDVRDGKLIGVRADGTVACSTKSLEGASFVARSWVKVPGSEQRNTLSIKIAKVVDGFSLGQDSSSRMAYDLVGEDGASLCSAAGSTAGRSKLGNELVTGLTDPAQGKSLVIPVESELYDVFGNPQQVHPKWKRQHAAWLQLACVDDALAKRSLYDLHSDSLDLSRSALRMLVANYCGRLHATKRGAEIAWSVVDDVKRSPHDPARLEAKWGSAGAVCVSKPRVLYGTGTAQVPTDLQGDLLDFANKCTTCTSTDGWTAALRECAVLHTNQPPRPSCEACTDAACGGRRLHSYVLPENTP